MHDEMCMRGWKLSLLLIFSSRLGEGESRGGGLLFCDPIPLEAAREGLSVCSFRFGSTNCEIITCRPPATKKALDFLFSFTV